MAPDGTTLAFWIVDNKIHMSQFGDSGWGAAEEIHSASGKLSSVQAVADAQGIIHVVWRESDSVTNYNLSLYSKRLDPATGWSEPTLLQNLPVGSDEQTVGISASGQVAVTWFETVGLYVKQVYANLYMAGAASGSAYIINEGDTWESIAQTLYGTIDVADELQTALGNPPLVAGGKLSNPPDPITDVVTSIINVPPYFTVQDGDTWQSIAQLVYDDAAAATALSSALGNPPLTAGAELTMPLTLTYDTLATRSTTTTVTSPLGEVSTYIYDERGRLLEAQQPAVNSQNPITRYVYDVAGNVKSVEDANGNIVSYGYDGSGNLLQQQDSAGNTVTYTYNADNQRVSETLYLKPDPDGGNAVQEAASPVTSRYVYDAEGHLRFVIRGEGRVS
jgi:YD repeat-containing protein